MKKILLICAATVALTSCGGPKYLDCDAYKTQYKPLKAEKHKRHHHQLCDAYN